jgi:hypothetical protein
MGCKTEYFANSVDHGRDRSDHCSRRLEHQTRRSGDTNGDTATAIAPATDAPAAALTLSASAACVVHPGRSVQFSRPALLRGLHADDAHAEADHAE